MRKSSLKIIFVFVIIIASVPMQARAIEFKDIVLIGAAYGTYLFLHEVGHQVVGEDVGADSPKIHFFTRQNGRFYPGYYTYKSVPKESKLPYAVGGFWMEDYAFEFALESYHRKPTTFNKALMFFGCANFLAYTLLANYVHPENRTYDPNLIRAETGLSKGAILSLVAAKTAIKAYRIFNPKARFIPWIRLDKTSAAFMIGIIF